MKLNEARLQPAGDNAQAHLFARDFGALLFDMDGTILSSIQAAERVWTTWARSHGLDVEAFLPTIHGVRAVETIRALDLPGVDPEAEAERLTLMEMDDMDGIEEIAGAAAFLGDLPGNAWAIVTSAPRTLAVRRLAAAGLPIPDVFVTADDVQHGKPAPDCFLLAAARLAKAPGDCLVFEDTLAGIRAAEAAGMAVVAVTATHRGTLESDAPAVVDYTALRVAAGEDGLLRLARAD
ncbi:MAG: HAD-IA family hydrolase [Sphingomonas sp.]